MRRTLGQEGVCADMTQDQFNDAAKALADGWAESGKNTLTSLCAVVDKQRVMQECHFPDGYASAQSAPVSDPRPKTCDVLWNERQKKGMGSLRALPLQRGTWLGQAAQPPAAPPAADATKAIGDSSFSQVLAAPKAVVMFYSPNCQYSQHFLPIYRTLSTQYTDTPFYLVNVLTDMQNGGTYNVHMLPTIVFFAGGKEVGRIDGAQEQGDFVTEMGRAFTGQAPASAATAPERAGTLLESTAAAVPSTPVGTYVLGGALGLGLLGLAGWAIFGK